MSELEGRRPLKVRDAGLAKSIAKRLSQRSITPNQISILSIFFAASAGGALVMSANTSPQGNMIAVLLAAVFIQCRLLCNLFDGMVAVEGGKSTPSGELFNDIPDRIADPIILVAAGYAIPMFPWGLAAGWSAGLLAVMTAYVRTLSASAGAPVDFGGPMAKQHRMALMTLACVLAAIEGFSWERGYVFMITLLAINVGCVATVARRAYRAYRFLEPRPDA